MCSKVHTQYAHTATIQNWVREMLKCLKLTVEALKLVTGNK